MFDILKIEIEESYFCTFLSVQQEKVKFLIEDRKSRNL